MRAWFNFFNHSIAFQSIFNFAWNITLALLAEVEWKIKTERCHKCNIFLPHLKGWNSIDFSKLSPLALKHRAFTAVSRLKIRHFIYEWKAYILWMTFLFRVKYLGYKFELRDARNHFKNTFKDSRQKRAEIRASLFSHIRFDRHEYIPFHVLAYWHSLVVRFPNYIRRTMCALKFNARVFFLFWI